MGKVLLSVVIAFFVVSIGNIFTMFIMWLYNGMEPDLARIVGLLMYTCFVIVLCTCLILSQINKK